jgi:hypothetical protein
MNTKIKSKSYGDFPLNMQFYPFFCAINKFRVEAYELKMWEVEMALKPLLDWVMRCKIDCYRQRQEW